MKIFIITEKYPFALSEKSFLLTELKELSKSNDVTVMSQRIGDIDPEFPSNINAVWLGEKANGLSAVFYLLGGIFSPSLYNELAVAFKTGGLGAAASCIKHFALARQYRSQIKKQIKELGTPDIIYSFWGNMPLTGMTLLRKKRDKWRLISRCHGYDLFRERAAYGYQPFKRQVDSKIDGMYLVCQAGYDYYLENWSVSKPPVCHLSRLGSSNQYGIQPYTSSDTLRLISCSNLIPLKRVGMIIEALSLTDGIKIDWVHYGSGELEDPLKKLAEEKLSAKKDISYNFAGYVDNTKLKDIYSRTTFDCFITASESEGGCPVSISEAISFGIPVIATGAGGIPEIVADDNGFLLSVQSTAQDICDAITSFASLSEEERLSLRQASCKKWEADFCAEDNAKAFAAAIGAVERRR